MYRHQWPLVGLLFCCGMLPATPGAADGAVAIGLPNDVARQGVAQGYSFNAKTPEEANATAMKFCLDESKSSSAAVALCKVVKNFRYQCVAFTLDPKPGTPGYGWGVGDDKAAAENTALAMCLGNAGADRRQFCKVVASDCDGTASNK